MEVKVRIRGLQGQDPHDEDAIEVVSIGDLYYEGDTLCVAYDEVVSEDDNGNVLTASNILKISDEQVEIVKTGAADTHMVFVNGKTTYTYYSTPIGKIEVCIHTKSVNFVKGEEGTYMLDLKYDLEMNQSFVSSCNVYCEIETQNLSTRM